MRIDWRKLRVLALAEVDATLAALPALLRERVLEKVAINNRARAQWVSFHRCLRTAWSRWRNLMGNS